MLAVDLQIHFLDAAWKPEPVLRAVAALAVRARSEGVPVVWIMQDGPAGSPAEHGEPGWQLHPAAWAEPGDDHIAKQWHDAFRATGLAGVLDGHGAGRLVVTGFATEHCIAATCGAALDRGYDVDLVDGAHTTLRRAPAAGRPPGEQEDAAMAERVRHLAGRAATGSFRHVPADEVTFGAAPGRA